jgi:hypothetical protein
MYEGIDEYPAHQAAVDLSLWHLVGMAHPWYAGKVLLGTLLAFLHTAVCSTSCVHHITHRAPSLPISNLQCGFVDVRQCSTMRLHPRVLMRREV